MASRVFRDLVASGYIELENKKITISRRMAGLLASAAIVGLAVVLVQSGNSGSGVPDTVVASINTLPATGAGRPSPVATAPDAARVGGALATGQVVRVYVKSAEGVFVEAGRAPNRLQEGNQRWAEVRFPEPVGGTTDSALAFLGDTRDEVGAGDVVEVRFSPTRDARAATDKEEARVTGLVERKDSALAREFERRIFARSEPSVSHLKQPAVAGR
jgi:hypothetical protein